jgi:outer membrane protein assembly factor BamB
MLIVGGRGMFAVRAGAAGNITPVKPDAEQKAAGNASTATPVTVVEWMSSEPAGVLWSKETGGPAMSSPLIYQGFVYICDRRGGIVTCYHAATGEQAYKERLPNAGEFWASPWAAGGKVYCQDAAGATYVLAPGPEFKVLATNRLEGRFWATSAVADGALLLRAADALYCVKNKASDAVRAVRADTAEPPIRR